MTAEACPTCNWRSQSVDSPCPDPYHDKKRLDHLAAVTAPIWPVIGDIMPDDRLLLDPAPNGGWTVSVVATNQAIMPKVIGAYSSAQDLINALMDGLNVQRLAP